MTENRRTTQTGSKAKPKTKAVGKRVGKSKPSKAKNQLNRRVK